MTEEEREELEEQVELGRKAMVALEFLNDFLVHERAANINQLELGKIYDVRDLQTNVLYLRVLKKFELSASTYIEAREIAEKELNKNGE